MFLCAFGVVSGQAEARAQAAAEAAAAAAAAATAEATEAERVRVEREKLEAASRVAAQKARGKGVKNVCRPKAQP